MQSAQFAASVNLLQSLSGALGLGGAWPLAIPSLMASDPTLPALGAVWQAPSLGWALLILPVLLMVGCLIGSVYLTLIAAHVRGEHPPLPRLIRWMLDTWARVLTLNVLLLVLIFIASLPLTIALVVANLIHPTLGTVALAVVTVLVLLFWAHGLFTLPALVLDRVNPIRAYWRSLVLVRYNFWSALGLMGLAFVLSAGLGELWRWLGEMPLALPIGMLGNAFVGTALTAAILAFYLDRRPAASG